MPKRRYGAFNQGEFPTIACFNKAKTPLRVDFDDLIAALQVYVNKYVAPVWGTPAKLIKTRSFRKGAWAMVFLDNAGNADAEAYHDLTPDGLPLAKIFVETTLDMGDLVSTSASHELVEMLVDPATNMMTTRGNSKIMYAYESADPVEELSFRVNGIPMSNFVYPAYFENFHKPGSVQFDHMKRVHKPFQILAGGYQTIFRREKWHDRSGSPAKAKRFAKEDRRGHRGAQRRKKTALLPANLPRIKKLEQKAGV